MPGLRGRPGPGHPLVVRVVFARFVTVDDAGAHRPHAGGNPGIYCNVKFTVTVMMTGTGTPLRSVGVYTHCLTASSAA